MAMCKIPVSAIVTVEDDGTVICKSTYREIDAQMLAAFLVRGFGIDVDVLSEESNTTK